MKIAKTQAPKQSFSFSNLAEGNIFEVVNTGNVYVLGNGVAIKIGNTKTTTFRQRTVSNPASYFSGKELLALKNPALSVQA